MIRFSAMTDKLPIVVILGATGAGKSKLALELAHKFGGEIISADAMQMYKGLDIITNKVTADEQRLVKHHMIDILESGAVNTVVEFRNTVLPLMERLLDQGKIPFICGGTNYYIESLLWKVLIDEAPSSPTLSNKRKPYLEPNQDDGSKKCKVADHDCNERTPVSPHDGQPEGLVSAPPSENLEAKASPGDDDLSPPGPLPALTNIDFSKDDDETVSSHQLYELLKQVDQARADFLHPNARRKIWRSLQVWHQHGVTHSQLLGQQGGVLGGGLRFPANRICIIEVWSDQKVLDERCDRRVDKMVERGMVEELIGFYNCIVKEKQARGENVDYSRGILQSIGFKEFGSFLRLEPEERTSPAGTAHFNEGVKLLKLATRQYSRRQAKWMKRRFLLETREAPPVYRVDSSEPNLWEKNCQEPAESILRAFLSGRLPETDPLARISVPAKEMEDNRRTHRCELCERDFTGLQQLHFHLNGAKHRRAVRQHQASLPPARLLLTHYDKSRRSECALILKQSLGKPIKEILTALNEVPPPVQIDAECPALKAERIKKCLAKHDIIVELEYGQA